jgi:hypothetical protein
MKLFVEFDGESAMDFTSRRLRRILTATAITCVTTLTGGCQSYPNLQVPGGTRVPPPATGSYNLQGQYYNNPNASTNGNPAPKNSTTSRSQPPATVVPASATWQSTNLPNNISRGISNLAEANDPAVTAAVYHDNGGSDVPVVSASAVETMDRESNIPAQRGLSDLPSSPNQNGQLQWQQP